jgi:hypothetical protein
VTRASKATGTAFDERDARGGAPKFETPSEGDISTPPSAAQVHRAGAGGNRTHGAGGLESTASEPPNRPSAVHITQEDRSGKGSFEKATGTAFDERDALSGVTSGPDKTSLAHRDRYGKHRAGAKGPPNRPSDGNVTQEDRLGKGSFEKATGTAFDERDALSGVTSGLDNTIVSHRNRRRKRRAGASGSRTRTRRMSSPLVGPPNRPSAVLITRGDAVGKYSFEKATGTAFDERDALSGMTGDLDAMILPYRRRRRNAGLERARVERALCSSRAELHPARVSLKKATGTAFHERDALSGMTGGLDAVILSYRGRRRNAGLERAGIEPAREGCRVLPTDHRVAPAPCTSRAELHSARVSLKKATGTAFDERGALDGMTGGP